MASDWRRDQRQNEYPEEHRRQIAEAYAIGFSSNATRHVDFPENGWWRREDCAEAFARGRRDAFESLQKHTEAERNRLGFR